MESSVHKRHMSLDGVTGYLIPLMALILWHIRGVGHIDAVISSGKVNIVL